MLTEAFILRDLEMVPVQFQRALNRLAEKIDAKNYDDVKEIKSNDVVIRFGKGTLPRERNTVHIGGKYYNKARQYEMLAGVVPTIETYEEYIEDLGDSFIAKKKNGQKQQGQLDSILPDDTTDYIFQPKVNIVKEYRVNIFYMNGSYHISGVYEKIGSNVSLKNVVELPESKILKKLAYAATKKLGYPFAGVDIALVNEEDAEFVVESVVGKMSSFFGKKMASIGSLKDILQETVPVVLEVNSYPSMANPMIAYDMFAAIEKAAI